MKRTTTQPIVSESSMSIVLSREEKSYLQGRITEALLYYRTLAGSAKCTEQNRAQHQLLEGLSKKLV